VETNNYDDWPSKGNPLNIRAVVKKELREIQGERGKDNNKN